MRYLSRRRWLAAVLLATLLPAAAAEAVIPSAFGPIQALIVILPQLLLALAAGMLAVFRPRTYRLLFAYLWAHKPLTAALIGVVAVLVWAPWSGPGGGAVAAEQVGAPWSAFRGGPQRSGAVPRARGPVGPTFLPWKLALGATSAVDSSPAVVGNRVYFGVSHQSAFGGGSGALACADADTGQLAWTWDGKGELAPPLRPVFSSPAVWVEKGAARFVVSGEGYHDDKNCRIVCLDLEPARKAGGKPRLLWSVQTTSHVESAPCIHDGKVFIGCGDDGVWAVELETGKVLWRLEGAPYYLVEGDAAAGLEGKTVVATGTVRRVGLGAKGKDDPGELALDVKTVREHAGAPVTSMDSGRTYERTVTGTVARKDGKRRLEMSAHYPDSESPPIGAMIGQEPAVLFGSGIGGQRVNCVNARTGAVLWTAATPYPAFGAPTVAGDRVLIGVGNGNFIMSDPNPAGAVIGLSLRDGKELWRVATPDTVIGAIAADGGRAYACCRDGQVYVLDVEKGTVVAKLAVGAPMVCSPAVTADSIYVSTDAGKVFGLDRSGGSVRWSQALTPGTMIVSSPAVAAGRLFVGTRSKGLVCIADRPADAETAPRPWLGAGGNAGRTGCADDRGLPQVEGDTADLRWPTPEELRQPVLGPMRRCEAYLCVPMGSGVAHVEASGRVREWTRHREDDVPRWHAYNLTFDVSEGRLGCKSDVGATLWRVKPETPPAETVSVSGELVFAACAGSGAKKGFLEARKVVDGALVWRAELDDAPVSYPVASSEWVAVATADDKIAAFRTADGKAREPVMVGGKPVAPALWKDTLVVAGEGRIAAYDLASSEWLWNYKDQDNIGTATGQPVVAGETIWVGTSKKGLLAIGIPPKP
jgi:outer membrane protein assembly factor BamB